MAGPAITRAHRALIGVVAAGAFIIAGIGFTGSYAAVRTLALHKGFGGFSYVFPIGVDVGIAVLLALDLVLTWLRIPFPLLRQTAWLLTGATVVFNAASSWGDPLAMGMHAIIPVLFVVVVEAARHAIGRMADITADRHMESVRLMRWVLSPVPTFRLWRRMKLWELRSYDDVVRLEQNRLVYRTHLRAKYGRNWRRQAPIETLLPLKLAKYGVPLDLDMVRHQAPLSLASLSSPVQLPFAPTVHPEQQVQPQQHLQPAPSPQPAPVAPHLAPAPQPAPHAAQRPAPAHQPAPAQAVPTASQPAAPQPVHPDPVAVTMLTKLASHRHRSSVQDQDAAGDAQTGAVEDEQGEDDGPEAWFAPKTVPEPEPHPDYVQSLVPAYAPDFVHAQAADVAGDPLDAYLDGLVSYREAHGYDPDPARLAEHLYTAHGLTAPSGDRPIAPETIRRAWPLLQERFAARFE